ncbi:MAG TPA: helix-turn-helix domain-containing protein [Terriglobales bacterium]|nr:helix-turn-helix domain-containing protein [Terriglobales bacterium]
MTTLAFASTPCRRLSLERIDAAVSCRLGPTRIPGNEQPACFNRQVAMYLAKHVGGWSTTVIGRFYNGRDHSTVCYGIQRIESLRESDPEVDALITELKQKLGEEFVGRTEIVESPAEFAGISQAIVDQLADVVATRVCAYLEKRIHSSEQLNSSPKNKL